MSMTVLAVAALALGVVFLLFLGRRSRLRRQTQSETLVREFEAIELRFQEAPEQAELSRQLELLTGADRAGRSVEKKAKAAFPKAPKAIAGSASGEVAIQRIQKFFGTERFKVAVGGGEMAFYALWDGLDGSPFVETVHTINQQVAENMVVHGAEALDNVLPAVKTLFLQLGQLYRDHPEQVVELVASVAGLLHKVDASNVYSLLNHVFSAERLEIYAESLDMVAEPLLEGAAESLAAAGEGLGSLDLETAFQGDEAFSSPDFHFPVVTLMLSTVREVRLLDEGKTTLDTAIGNAALDVTGTGVGGWLGGKGGAAIGTAIFPGPGTVIGGVLGAVGGALLGRYGTDQIKLIDAREAQTAYDSACSRMKSATRESARRAHAELVEIQAGKRRDFEQRIGPAPRLEERCEVLRQGAGQILAAWAEAIEKLRRDLLTARSVALAEAPRDTWYDPLVGGKLRPEVESRIEASYRAKLGDLENLERRVPGAELCERDPARALQRMMTIPIAEGTDLLVPVEDCTRETEALRAALVSNLVVWGRNATTVLQEVSAEIPRDFEPHAEDFRRTCEKQTRKVRKREKRLRRELEKVGAL